MVLASLLSHAARLDNSGAAASITGIIVTLVIVALVVLEIAALWIIFAKAGKPGWAAIIPIYNYIVLLQVVGRPIWWFILFFIPLVDIVILIIVLNDLSKSFGHGVGFTLGLLFFAEIFFPILAFGGSRYVGPAALAVGGQMPMNYQRQ